MGAPRASAGHTLGRYRLIAELGHGGMADVFLAVVRGPAGFHKLLVVKQLRPNLAEDPEFLTMFLDEARLAARLSHRNVVQTHEVGIDDGAYFLAMEYLDGQALKRIAHRARPAGIPLAMHLRILSETLAGLHHAHELRDFDGTPLAVVHRDVSPHNVFVTYAGEVKVVDFGIAKALDSSAETGAGVMKGKLAYMSPEQARSERVDRRADIFSMGVLMWEAIVGRRMWEGMTSAAIVNRLLGADLPRLRDHAPDVPAELESICRRALAHAPEDRFSSAAEFQQAVDGWLESVGDRTTYHEIGAFVSSLFVDDRRMLQAVVEKQLAAVDAMSTGEFLAVQLPEIERSLSNTLTPSGQKGSGSSRRGAREDVAGPAPNASGPPGSTPGPTVRESLQSTPARSRASRWTLFALLGALSAVAIAALVFGLGSRHLDQPGAGTVASSAHLAAPPASHPAPLPSQVELTIDVQPHDAVVYLDENLLAGDPPATKVPRGSSHVVRAQADGYVTITREVTSEENTTIELSLDHAAPAQSASPGAAPIGSGDMGYVQPKRPNPPQTKRPLDGKDPWSP